MKGVKGILLMGGKGERFGSVLPKQFQQLANKKVYLWAFESLYASALFEEVLLICPEEWVEEVAQEVGKRGRAVVGGATRQASSYQGLLQAGNDTKIVVIHDAVRPFVSHRILQENINLALQYGAVDTCLPSVDTMVYSLDGKKITAIPPRAHLLRGQTPQSFQYPLLLQAHQKTKKTNASDDCQLVLELGKEVAIVEGEEANFKITTLQDLAYATSLVSC